MYMILDLAMTFSLQYQNHTPWKKIDSLDFIKMKNIWSVKDTVKRIKNKPQTGRKYLKNLYLISDFFFQNIQSS